MMLSNSLCCLHAEQVLPQLPVPYRRLRSPGLRYVNEHNVSVAHTAPLFTYNPMRLTQLLENFKAYKIAFLFLHGF